MSSPSAPADPPGGVFHIYRIDIAGYLVPPAIPCLASEARGSLDSQ
jgi:hypothetical protein